MPLLRDLLLTMCFRDDRAYGAEAYPPPQQANYYPQQQQPYAARPRRGFGARWERRYQRDVELYGPAEAYRKRRMRAVAGAVAG